MRISVDKNLQSYPLPEDVGFELGSGRISQFWSSPTEPREKILIRFSESMRGGGRRQFQSESHPHFLQFSSNGWKIHLRIPKGSELDTAKHLNDLGLYYKVESGMGSYFNGNRSSGATIYIGSFDEMLLVRALIIGTMSDLLLRSHIEQSDQTLVKGVSGRRFYGGSNSDMPLGQEIAARFDVQRSAYSEKYSDYGFNAVFEFLAIPLLKSTVDEYMDLEQRMSAKPKPSSQYFYQCMERIK